MSYTKGPFIRHYHIQYIQLLI